MIAETVPKIDYLKHEETFQQFKREHLEPKISDRSTRRQWAQAGFEDAWERSKKRVNNLLRSHAPELLMPELRTPIDSLISEYTKEFGLKRLESF